MALTAVTKKAGAAFVPPRRRVVARKGRKTQKTLIVKTPECFDKEFWAELCEGLEAHGMTGEQYLRILAEVRADLRGKSKEEVLNASGMTKDDIARAKREGRWIGDN